MFNTMLSFFEKFKDEQSCIDYLKAARWGENPFCPECGHQKVYEFKDQKTFKCSKCKKRFSIRYGTIFQSSQLPLKKWFLAIYLLTGNKKGIASTQLSRELGVTQKTAWFMLQRIRLICQSDIKSDRVLSGIVEVDETFIGGKEKNKHPSKRVKGTQGRSTKTKAVVVGLIERGGEIRLKHVNNVQGKTVRKVVQDNVEPASRIMTDEFVGYRKLEEGYFHQSVNHSKGIYGEGDVYTNTIEGAFSLLKRGILGIYHKVSHKHLELYLAEFEFRYDTRALTSGKRFGDLMGQCNKYISYQQLINP